MHTGHSFTVWGRGLSPSEMWCLAIAGGRVSGRGYLPRRMYIRGSLLWEEAPPDYQHTLLDKEHHSPPNRILDTAYKKYLLGTTSLLPVTVLVIKMHCSLIRKLPTSRHIWVVHVQYMYSDRCFCNIFSFSEQWLSSYCLIAVLDTCDNWITLIVCMLLVYNYRIWILCLIRTVLSYCYS